MSILGIYASAISGNLAPSSPVAGYSLWLDAADTAKITVSGTSVTQWQDKANNYNFTQGTAAKQPKSGTRTINGKNVIDFDGGDGLVGTMAASVFKFTTDGDASFFAVALTDGTAGGRFATNNPAGSPGVGFFWGLVPSTNRAFFDLYRGVSGTVVIGAGFTNPTVSSGTAFVNSVLTDPSNGTAANRSFVRINKGTVINTNTSTGSPSTDDPTSPITLGSSVGVDDDFFDGALAEILMYNTKLSDTNRDLNIDYLMNKWGIV
jgi:hypothetical protein